MFPSALIASLLVRIVAGGSANSGAVHETVVDAEMEAILPVALLLTNIVDVAYNEEQRDFTQKIDRIMDGQKRQAEAAASELREIFTTVSPRPRQPVDMDPQQAVDRLAASYAESLRESWDTMEQEEEMQKSAKNDIVLRVYLELMKMLFGLDSGINNDESPSHNTPSESSDRQPKLFLKANPVELTSRHNEKNSDLHDVTTTKTSKTTKVDSEQHMGKRVIINENTTINELLTKVGEDCLSVMLCNAGADPDSMGSFGPWAVNNFHGRRWRYFYPDLAAAYFAGHKRTFFRDYHQYCAARFPKCVLHHTVQSSIYS